MIDVAFWLLCLSSALVVFGVGYGAGYSQGFEAGLDDDLIHPREETKT
jgi:hypothetical protein